MKNAIRVFGIIALIAVIGFMTMSCSSGGSSGGVKASSPKMLKASDAGYYGPGLGAKGALTDDQITANVRKVQSVDSRAKMLELFDVLRTDILPDLVGAGYDAYWQKLYEDKYSALDFTDVFQDSYTSVEERFFLDNEDKTKLPLTVDFNMKGYGEATEADYPSYWANHSYITVSANVKQNWTSNVPLRQFLNKAGGLTGDSLRGYMGADYESWGSYTTFHVGDNWNLTKTVKNLTYTLERDKGTAGDGTDAVGYKKNAYNVSGKIVVNINESEKYEITDGLLQYRKGKESQKATVSVALAIDNGDLNMGDTTAANSGLVYGAKYIFALSVSRGSEDKSVSNGMDVILSDVLVYNNEDALIYTINANNPLLGGYGIVKDATGADSFIGDSIWMVIDGAPANGSAFFKPPKPQPGAVTP